MSVTVASVALREVDRAAPSTDQIWDALAPALGVRRPGTRIVDIERRPGAYGSSWWLEDVTLRLDDGSRAELVFKDLGREAHRSDARRIKPAFVCDPAREGWVYRTVLSTLRTGAPQLWAAVSDAYLGRHWLFLERVDGCPLWQIGDHAIWHAAARWLAELHATASVPRVQSSPLLRHDRAYHRAWLARALDAAAHEPGSRLARRAPQERLARLRALAAAHELAIDEALSADETLLHGELYPSNVLVDVRRTTCRVHPVDWEMAAVGPALLDLAALLSGGWEPDARIAIAMAYRDRALEAGAAFETPGAFLRRLSACRLLLAVQWLGWARGWQPPPEHGNDWLEEAERCAEELM